MILPWFQKLVRDRMYRPARRAAPRRPARRPRLEHLEERCVLDAALGAEQIEGLQANIKHIIVIYQENWSFDGLYGSFPGANGISNASQTSLTQVDRTTGQPLSSELGPNDLNRAYTSGPATLNNPPPPLTGSNTPDPRFLNPDGSTKVDTLHPYDASTFISTGDKTGDIVHRFYQEQSQIDGGKQDQYVTWSDNPGLVMSHFDATNLPEGQLAQQYALDDNYFHSAYGGSFLNHQFFVAADTPVYANAPTSMLAVVDSTGQLALYNSNDDGGNHALDGKIIHDGNITPTTAQAAAEVVNGYALHGLSPFDKNYAINTIFSANLVPPGTSKTSPALLPSQNDNNPNGPNYIQTIGDLLDSNGVSWKWYSGDWNLAVAVQKGAYNPTTNPNGDKTYTADVAQLNADSFQWHHQPLAYYNNFAPYNPDGSINQLSAAHLQDENNLFSDLQFGNLPAVSFVKQFGANNEHPGYADVLQGQQATAAIVQAVQNSPDWSSTAIVITYDENGGRWDHVAPPTTDINGVAWGDGTRVPLIVISPFSKGVGVVHAQEDTSSILKTIEEDFTNGQGLHNPGNLDTKANDLLSNFQFPGVDKDSPKEQQHDRQELKKLQGELKTADKDLATDQELEADLQTALTADQARAADLTAQLQAVQNDIIADIKSGKKSDLKQDQKEEARLEAALAQLTAQSARDQKALDKAEHDLKTDQKNADSLEARIKDLQADIAEDQA